MTEPITAAPAAATRAGAGGEATDPEALRRTAEEFEAVFLAQMLRTMSSGLEAGGPFFGGRDGGPFNDMLNQEVAKLISRSGGVGVADAILQEMLKLQEIA